MSSLRSEVVWSWNVAIFDRSSSTPCRLRFGKEDANDIENEAKASREVKFFSLNTFTLYSMYVDIFHAISPWIFQLSEASPDVWNFFLPFLFKMEMSPSEHLSYLGNFFCFHRSSWASCRHFHIQFLSVFCCCWLFSMFENFSLISEWEHISTTRSRDIDRA